MVQELYRIGQAGEFDYSGSQAIKALKEEGIKTVLLIQILQQFKHLIILLIKCIFFQLILYFVEKVIEKEKPDGILLGFGGQTALNVGVELYEKGILKKYNVEVLGTPIESIMRYRR